MTDAPDPSPAVTPRPVDAAIAANWRAFFARGEVFAVPVAGDIFARKLRNNTIVLAVLALLAVVSATGAVVLVSTDAGRAFTYVALAALSAVSAAAFLRILFIRRRLSVICDAPEEYLAVSKTGIRFAGIEFPWAAIVGGLVIDERGERFGGLKALTAKVMLAVGYSRVEMLLGVQEGTAAQYRDRAPGAVRKAFFVSMGSGGVRIPLQYAVDDDAIDAVTTAARVSAADSDVPIIVSRQPAVVQATVSAIWRGRRPGQQKGDA